MTTAIAEPDTLADIIRELGDIPLHRILWHPRPGTAIEADQLRLVDGEPKRLVELIDGILVEKAMGYRESLLAMTLGSILYTFVRFSNLGVVATADAIMRLQPGLNRLPDVSFTAWTSLPSNNAHLQPVADFPPDLAVEVVSEGNTRAEIDRKRREFLAAGTKLVWIIEPEDRTVEVYADPQQPDLMTRLRVNDTLDGGTILPGFTLPLTDLFNDPQLNPRP